MYTIIRLTVTIAPQEMYQFKKHRYRVYIIFKKWRKFKNVVYLVKSVSNLDKYLFWNEQFLNPQ